jgi:hypothetical protein
MLFNYNIFNNTYDFVAPATNNNNLKGSNKFPIIKNREFNGNKKMPKKKISRRNNFQKRTLRH